MPSLTEIILNNDALKGQCNNKGQDTKPYTYVNTLQLHSNAFSPIGNVLDIPSLHSIVGSSTLSCIGYVELSSIFLFTTYNIDRCCPYQYFEYYLAIGFSLCIPRYLHT